MPWEGNASFDSDTIALLRGVLKDTVSAFPPHQQTLELRDVSARAIFRLAEKGERDRERLHASALSAIAGAQNLKSREPETAFGAFQERRSG